MASSGKINIRWNSYTSVLQNVFRRYLEQQLFVDVALACEGKTIKCHRVILSACSTYFDEILSDNQDSDLIIYLKDVKFWELRALVTYMYNGEIKISQHKLPDLCRAAEELKIKGLSMNPSLVDPGLVNGDFDRFEEDDNTEEDFHVDANDINSLQQINRQNSLGSQQNPVLRQPHQQIKRKIVQQPPPKLVKMPRLVPAANGLGNNAGINLKQHSISTVDQQLPLQFKTAEWVNQGAFVEEGMDGYDEAYENEVMAGSSIEDDGESVMEEDEKNENMEDGDDNDSLVSEGIQLVHRANTKKFGMRYGQETRNSAVAALESGMSLRECSEMFGISRMLLSKWRSRSQKLKHDALEGDAPSQSSTPTTSTKALPPKKPMGAPIPRADRVERLKKATELALSGVAVRQSAAQFGLPRTTLIAYMKRNGFPTSRSFTSGNGNGQNNSDASWSEASGESDAQATAVPHYEDDVSGSQLIDHQMGQGSYDGNEEYADGEEEY